VAGPGRCKLGGILGLVELIDEHRGAFEYDWRTRFHLPLSDVPEVMPWDEALRLTSQLVLDPTAHVAVAIGGWSYPMPREAMVLADVYDLTAHIHADPKRRGSIEPYPRPWPDPRKTRFGKATRSQAEIRAALAARGH
jgi:hypothetical protein